ncbi:hypothetical protein NL676_011719 [Syzygium grande]|nr:hypothetical protein NL676_011719 [Syzygium grande]
MVLETASALYATVVRQLVRQNVAKSKEIRKRKRVVVVMTFVANEKGRKGMEAGVTRYTKNRQSLSFHIEQIFSSTRLHAIKCFVRPDAVACDGNAANATKIRLSFNSDSRSYEDPNLQLEFNTHQKLKFSSSSIVSLCEDLSYGSLDGKSSSINNDDNYLQASLLLAGIALCDFAGVWAFNVDVTVAR